MTVRRSAVWPVLVACALAALAHAAPAAEKPPVSQAVTFASPRDSAKLAGQYFPGDGKGPVLVVMPRGRGAAADRLPSVKEFLARGFSVLLFDYRDFPNPAAPVPDTLRHVLLASRWVDDAVGAARWAREACGGRPVFGWGQEAGSPVALAAAARAGRPYDAVAVEGLWRQTSEQMRFNGTAQIPGVQERHRALVRGNDEPISVVPMLQVPLLVVIAGRDSITPPRVTREVARRSASLIEQYFVDEAGHEDAEKTPGYYDALASWFRNLVAQMSPH